jgi:hypothetical protein
VVVSVIAVDNAPVRSTAPPAAAAASSATDQGRDEL